MEYSNLMFPELFDADQVIRQAVPCIRDSPPFGYVRDRELDGRALIGIEAILMPGGVELLGEEGEAAYEAMDTIVMIIKNRPNENFFIFFQFWLKSIVKQASLSILYPKRISESNEEEWRRKNNFTPEENQDKMNNRVKENYE